MNKNQSIVSRFPLLKGLFLLVAVFTMTAFFSADAAAQNGKSVKQLLDELDIDYEVQSGNYFIPVRLDNDRFQVVIIEPALIRTKGEKPFRVVSSFAYSVKGSVPANLKNRINQITADDIQWSLIKDAGESLLQYMSFADEDVTSAELREILLSVAQEADSVEQELTGKDDF